MNAIGRGYPPGQFRIEATTHVVQALTLKLAQNLDVFRRDPLKRAVKCLARGRLLETKLPPDFNARKTSDEELHDLAFALLRCDDCLTRHSIPAVRRHFPIFRAIRRPCLTCPAEIRPTSSPRHHDPKMSPAMRYQKLGLVGNGVS
jgi:hypothetical protein